MVHPDQLQDALDNISKATNGALRSRFWIDFDTGYTSMSISLHKAARFCSPFLSSASFVFTRNQYSWNNGRKGFFNCVFDALCQLERMVVGFG